MPAKMTIEVLSGKEPKKIDKSSKDKFNFAFLQIMVWALITLIIIVYKYISNEKHLKAALISLGIWFLYYELYYITYNFIAPEWRHLSNIRSPSQINKMMQNFFTNQLLIIQKARSWKSTCWNCGKIRKILRGYEVFSYYSGRDISGVFSIHTNKLSGCWVKSMLKLNLKIDYEFAEELSRLDHNKQIDSFIESNKDREGYFELLEEKVIDGFEEHVLINLSERQSLSINRVLYFIFVIIIPVIELYKIYLNICWADQTFTIKRVISTRFDLNDNQFVKKYSNNVPKLSFGGNEQTFGKVYYTHDRKIYQSPTQDEINEAPAINEILLQKLSSYKINYKSDVNDQNYMAAPQYNSKQDFNQGELQMKGYPNLEDSLCVNTPTNLQKPPVNTDQQISNESINSIKTNRNLNTERELKANMLDSGSRVELKRKFFE